MHLQGIYIRCIWCVLGNSCVRHATTKSQSPQWWRRQTYSFLGWRCGELRVGLGWSTSRVSSYLSNASLCFLNLFRGLLGSSFFPRMRIQGGSIWKLRNVMTLNYVMLTTNSRTLSQTAVIKRPQGQTCLIEVCPTQLGTLTTRHLTFTFLPSMT